jgi:putative oxygen-independent coproporphyrinogen III oxidase
MTFSAQIPLSLYVHIPWCVRKCPYCDFNSHEAKSSLPQELYVAALLQELDHHLPLIPQRPLLSIFFGGGTPSLFSAQAIGQILEGIAKRVNFHPQIEITLEANPGTIDLVKFRDFHLAGINRLSMGIQSLQDDKLKALGRIHDAKTAMQAIEIAKKSGFTNFNLDLMYGLPQQSLEDALHDLRTALTFGPPHFSWYQLTIEPNTLFHHQPPALPVEDAIWEMQLAGQQLLQEFGLRQYEVSAYAPLERECVHNRNYWEFGDYLGIGAGAHSKITKAGTVLRFAQVKNPRDYLELAKRQACEYKPISEKDLIFEFMLNGLRLCEGVTTELFMARTGVSLARIEPMLMEAKRRGLLRDEVGRICATERGKRFLNDLVGGFLGD